MRNWEVAGKQSLNAKSPPICAFDFFLPGQSPPNLTSGDSPLSSTVTITSFKTTSQRKPLSSPQNSKAHPKRWDSLKMAAVASKKGLEQAVSAPAVTPSSLSPESTSHISTCSKTCYSGSQAEQSLYEHIL